VLIPARGNGAGSSRGQLQAAVEPHFPANAPALFSLLRPNDGTSKRAIRTSGRWPALALMLKTSNTQGPSVSAAWLEGLR
jgi:hypothetical protein